LRGARRLRQRNAWRLSLTLALAGGSAPTVTRRFRPYHRRHLYKSSVTFFSGCADRRSPQQQALAACGYSVLSAAQNQAMSPGGRRWRFSTQHGQINGRAGTGDGGVTLRQAWYSATAPSGIPPSQSAARRRGEAWYGSRPSVCWLFSAKQNCLHPAGPRTAGYYKTGKRLLEVTG